MNLINMKELIIKEWVLLGIIFYIKQRKQFGITQEIVNTKDVNE